MRTLEYEKVGGFLHHKCIHVISDANFRMCAYSSNVSRTDEKIPLYHAIYFQLRYNIIETLRDKESLGIL